MRGIWQRVKKPPQKIQLMPIKTNLRNMNIGIEVSMMKYISKITNNDLFEIYHFLFSSYTLKQINLDTSTALSLLNKNGTSIANKVSKIGNPKIITGRTIAIKVYVFANPNMEIVASTNPKKFEPESPIKVLAGLKL